MIKADRSYLSVKLNSYLTQGVNGNPAINTYGVSVHLLIAPIKTIQMYLGCIVLPFYSPK